MLELLQPLWNQYWPPILTWLHDPRITVPTTVILTAILYPYLKDHIGKWLDFCIKWLLASFSGHQKDYFFERHYLDWLIGQSHFIGSIPAPMISRKWTEDRKQFAGLEEVYVRLSMAVQGGDEEWAEHYGKHGNSWRRRPLRIIGILKILCTVVFPPLAPIFLLAAKQLTPQNEKTYTPGDLGLVVDRHKRLVIRGDPGSGKTTLLKFLALTCARTRRNDRKKGDSPHLVQRKLSWHKKPFPLYVTLRRHGNVTHWDSARELIAVFTEELPAEMRNICPKDFFANKLRKGNCLILLDAFDELGTQEARDVMAQKINGLLSLYDREDNRIVVTTRKVGYEGQLDKLAFDTRTVQELNAGEIRALIRLRYSAIMDSEIRGRSAHDAEDIRQLLQVRPALLVERIESTPRLNQLATNPMLLSLIVLVHSLNVDLPEERVRLYRDCVEILTELWERNKIAELGLKREERKELLLDQKLALLYEIAFAMQQKRQDESSQALINKETVQEIIVHKLPEFINTDETIENKRLAFYNVEANKWIDGIKTESGILVEMGVNATTGNPVVGFSHLTFQEYMAAIAAAKNSIYQTTLWHNLLNPTWREVTLLYAASISDATPVVNKLLDAPNQPYGLLLASYCLAERLQHIDPTTQLTVLTKIADGFMQASDSAVGDFGKVMGELDQKEAIEFLVTQVQAPSEARRLAAIKALGQADTNNTMIQQIRLALVPLLETNYDVTTVVAAREALSRIGDPRFLQDEPVMVRIALPSPAPTASFQRWQDLFSIAVWKRSPRQFIPDFSQLGNRCMRHMDIWFSIVMHKLRRQPSGTEIDMSKYPVTNIEYRRFIDATKHKPPTNWLEGTYPVEEATHPVRGIRFKDAQAYCKWLSKKSSKKYRLPTEWEWEWAATGSNGWLYPWGDQFDKDRCNTKAAGNEKTTPVGTYITGASTFGLNDMCGNVSEIATGFPFAICSLSYIFTIIVILILSFIPSPATFTHNTFPHFDFQLFTTFLIFALFYYMFIFIFLSSISPLFIMQRGGAWNSTDRNATCFFRRFGGITSNTGFRCVREV